MCYEGYPELRTAEARELARLANQAAEEHENVLVALRGDGKNRELVEFDSRLSRYIPMYHMTRGFIGHDPFGPLNEALRLSKTLGKGNILVLVEKGAENAAALYIEYFMWMVGDGYASNISLQTFRLSIPWHIRMWNEYLAMCQVAVLAQTNTMSKMLHA